MQHRALGKTSLMVSPVCMGCMGFGDAAQGQHSWTLGEADSRAILLQGLESGINFFDTAIAYQSGTSEQYLGRALKDFARREEVVVATKFLPRTQAEIESGVSGQEHIQKMLDKSLRNLGMDYVDLYIYHMWDYQTPLIDIMDGLNRAVKAGKARYIGISNCFAWQLCKANALAEREGWAKFVSIQGHYNLIFREEEREMIPFCREENIALTPYSALAGGRLAKQPGETSRRLEEDSYAHLKYDATQAARHEHDRHFPGLAHGQGRCARGGHDEAAPRGRRGRGQRFDADGGGNRLAGRALCAARAGGRDGAKHRRRGKRAACVVHRQAEYLTPRRLRGGIPPIL